MNSQKFKFHPSTRTTIYDISFYERDKVFKTSCDVADTLIKTFSESEEFAALLKKDKSVKAWYESFQARKEYDAGEEKRRKAAEEKRKKAEEEREHALQRIASKLTPEEIEACGIKLTTTAKKGKK